MTPRSLVLGLDASARRIGWALVDYETAEFVGVGCETTPAGDDLRHRRNAVREIARIANLRGDVFAVFVEDAYAGPSRRGTIDHAGAVGNVEAFALDRWPTILVSRLAPSTWRSILKLPPKGKTGVWAWAIALGVYDRFELQDEADALAIATAGQYLVWDVGDRTSDAKTTLTTSPNGKEATGEQVSL